MKLLRLSIAFFLLSYGVAEAYVGPGLGSGVIAAIFGIISSFFLAIFAVVWYPIKRRLKKWRNKDDAAK